MMKWLALVAILLAVYPAGLLLRKRPLGRTLLLAAIGFLPFYRLPAVTFNPISFESYRGDSTGLEVTLVDVFAAILLFALPAAKHASPMRVVRALYLLVVLASVFIAPEPQYAFFGLWKLLRMYLVVTVMARAFDDAAMGPVYLRGVGAGILYAFLQALNQRYLHHQHQVFSTFPHQNSLGMALNLVAPIVLAIALAGQGGVLAWITLAASAATIMLTLSRGSIVVFVVTIAMVYLASLARGITRRKVVAAAAAAAVVGLLLAKSLRTIVERFLDAPEASAESRVYFERAAHLMLSDHPFGIGMNQFSHVLRHGGYAARIGMHTDLDGVVHNVYWLTASELGYVGFAVFLVLLAFPLIIAIRGASRAGRDIRGDVLLGCAGGLAAMYAQSTLEWIPRQTAQGYLFWCLVALVSALDRQLRERRQAGASAV